jgi:hypothetical protein
MKDRKTSFQKASSSYTNRSIYLCKHTHTHTENLTMEKRNSAIINNTVVVVVVITVAFIAW